MQDLTSDDLKFEFANNSILIDKFACLAIHDYHTNYDGQQ